MKNCLTLCRWAWSLFLASVVSLTLVLKALLTPLNWFHISLAHARSVLSISPLRRSEAARSFWDLAMFSWVYLTQESGIVILQIQKTEDPVLLKYKPAWEVYTLKAFNMVLGMMNDMKLHVHISLHVYVHLLLSVHCTGKSFNSNININHFKPELNLL